MSFASYKPTVTIEYHALSDTVLTSNVIETVFSKVLSSGTYFISFCPAVTGGNLSLVTAEIGSELGGLNQQTACQWFGTPYNYYNMEYEQICMAGTFISNGEDALTIQLSATTTTTWNYATYDGTSYNLVIMKLT